MSVIAEAEKLVFSLSETERARLVGKILRTLPSSSSSNDDGIETALRRSEELRNDPERGISIEELDRRMSERFGWKL